MSVSPTSSELPPFEPQPAASLQEQNFAGAIQLSETVLSDSILASHQADPPEVARAIEAAQGSLIRANGADGAYTIASRQIETQLDAGQWTDPARQAAVALSSAQRTAMGQPDMSFETATNLANDYAQTWKGEALVSGDRWLNDEATALGAQALSAARGGVGAINDVMRQVEGMLHTPGQDPHSADELRAMRDALFIQRQQLQAAEARQQREAQAMANQSQHVDTARSGVAAAYDLPSQPPGGESDQPAAEVDPIQKFNQDLVWTASRLNLPIQEIGLSRLMMTQLAADPVLRQRVSALFTEARTAASQATGDTAQKIAIRTQLRHDIAATFAG